MNDSTRIYFAGRYTYRRPHVLFGSFLAIAFGAFALRYLVLGIYHTAWSLKALGAAAFIGTIGSLLAFCGLVLLKRWFIRTCLELEISSAGIRFGKAFHSWEAIRWVSGHSDRKKARLFYQTKSRGLSGFDRPLPVDHNPTPDEFIALMESLKSEVGGRFPDVGFG